MGDLRALSVWNPWAWALTTHVEVRRGPLKTLENRGRFYEDPKRPGRWKRTGQLWRSQKGAWTLIHTGLRTPDEKAVRGVEALARTQFHGMPEWAKHASRSRDANGKRIGSIVGAVVFRESVVPEEVPDGYDRIWVNEYAGYCWMVDRAVSFDEHIPCAGFQGFFHPPPEVQAKAREQLPK